MQEEKRMAGSYEIKQSIHIGNREVVYGEDAAAKPGEQYLCGYCSSNDLFRSYEDCQAGDYLEIMELFFDRIHEQVLLLQAEQAQMSPEMKTPISTEQCFPHDYSENIKGKVVAVHSSILRPE